MSTNFKIKFGKRIKELRKRKGYTQEQIAEIVGIEPPNISKLEKGIHFPQPENIERLASALDVKVNEMFDFEHLGGKSYMVENIHKFVDTAEEKEIEFLYQFITNLSIFKNK